MKRTLIWAAGVVTTGAALKLLDWAYCTGVRAYKTRPGKPLPNEVDLKADFDNSPFKVAV